MAAKTGVHNFLLGAALLLGASQLATATSYQVTFSAQQIAQVMASPISGWDNTSKLGWLGAYDFNNSAQTNGRPLTFDGNVAARYISNTTRNTQITNGQGVGVYDFYFRPDDAGVQQQLTYQVTQTTTTISSTFSTGVTAAPAASGGQWSTTCAGDTQPANGGNQGASGCGTTYTRNASDSRDFARFFDSTGKNDVITGFSSLPVVYSGTGTNLGYTQVNNATTFSAVYSNTSAPITTSTRFVFFLVGDIFNWSTANNRWQFTSSKDTILGAIAVTPSSVTQVGDPVPEPSSILLLGSAMLGGTLVWRRRARS